VTNPLSWGEHVFFFVILNLGLDTVHNKVYGASGYKLKLTGSKIQENISKWCNKPEIVAYPPNYPSIKRLRRPVQPLKTG